MQPKQQQQQPKTVTGKMLTVQQSLARAGYVVIRQGNLLLITAAQPQQKAV